MNAKIKVSEFDFCRLQKLLKFNNRKKLKEELSRAEIINSILVPPDLVTLDSTIIYRLNNRIQQSTLVFEPVPDDQSVCVSVLDELGTALLGMSENQSVVWTFPHGLEPIHILSVVSQPESNGEIHPLCFE